MKYYICLLWALVTLADLAAQTGSFRQIYLFAPTANNDSLVQQQRILATDTEGVKERDLRVTVVLSEPRNSKLWKRYNVQPDKFTFVLIGKDGGEKFRSTKTLSLERLFTLIDGMPMRKDEMRRRH
jgi:Domain of unknown function (DUF4174)